MAVYKSKESKESEYSTTQAIKELADTTKKAIATAEGYLSAIKQKGQDYRQPKLEQELKNLINGLIDQYNTLQADWHQKRTILENKAKEVIQKGNMEAAKIYAKVITPLEENEKQAEQIKNKLSDLRKQLEEL